MTTFTGFPFATGEVYNYLQAKRLLQLAMDELRQREDRTCKATAERGILDGVAASWIGCSPLLKTMGLA